MTRDIQYKEVNITQKLIEQGLQKLEIVRGDLLEIHGSLSSFGNVVGGPEAVINAVLGVIGDGGTVIMSAYPVGKVEPLTPTDKVLGIHWKARKLKDTGNTKTGMGVIVDTFVNRADTTLGEGGYRVCAWGKNKDAYAKEGYKPFCVAKGKVVLLGVGIDRCSSLHLAEDQPLPEEIEKYFKISPKVLTLYPESEWSVGGEDPPGDAWGKVFKWAKNTGLVKSVIVGKAICYSFPIKPLVDEYRRLRQKDPYGLFDVTRK